MAVIDNTNFIGVEDVLSNKSSGLSVMAAVYMGSELAVAACSTFGNSLIIASFIRNSYLRSPTNLYVFSLAVADLMVSVVGIPIYLYSMITSLPSDYLACLIVNTWIMMLCTVSIFHLVAVSYDRYLAVVWLRQPDSQRDRMRHAALSIGSAWTCGTIIGFLPLMGWNRGPSARGLCFFMEIMDMRYLMFLFYCTIIAPTFLMAFFYASIFRVVRSQDQRMTGLSRSTSILDRGATAFRLDSATKVEAGPGDEAIRPRCHSTRMRERIGGISVDIGCISEERVDTSESRLFKKAMDASYGSLRRHPTTEKNSSSKKKATKTRRVTLSFVLVIVSFLLSWYPLYTLNAITYYTPHYPIDQIAFYACIVLSHLSTTINPLIYARTMPGFREALLEILCCQKPGSRRRQRSSLRFTNNNNSVNPTEADHE